MQVYDQFYHFVLDGCKQLVPSGQRSLIPSSQSGLQHLKELRKEKYLIHSEVSSVVKEVEVYEILFLKLSLRIHLELFQMI